MLDIKRVIASAPRKPRQEALRNLTTPWSEQAACGNSCAGQHPRPQFARESYTSLDGWWDYAVVPAQDARRAWQEAPAPSRFEGRVLVPFSPEAPLSGVGRQLQAHELLWYRRVFFAPDEAALAGRRLILHFGAVDYACACLCNGQCVGRHVGGYLAFSFDVTDELRPGENELALCVYDPSEEGVQLRGKQRRERGGIWYSAQSGIWQSVWLETVPEERIESLRIDARPDAKRVVIGAGVRLSAQRPFPDPDTPLEAELFEDGRLVARGSAAPEAAGGGAGAFGCTLALDLERPRLWSPDDPYLYRLRLSYGQDRVESYCAFRSVAIERDSKGVPRFFLNGRPLFLRGVLDQGYWPDGLMSAPSDEALAFDVRSCKELGFNLVRKHVKIESDRFYYHCDRLGLLVLQDMVCGGARPRPWHASYKPTFFRSSWGRFPDDGPRRRRKLSAGDQAYRREWLETCEGAVEQLRNHPSIVAWGLFNEGWGQFDARRACQAVRALDPARPIDAVSGWYDQACGDFLSVHNYFRPLKVYRDRARPPRAFLLSEFGGLSFRPPGHASLSSSYGYASYSDAASFRKAVLKTLAEADALEAKGLAGFVYTQLNDVEAETNGLLSYDRRVNKLAKGWPA